MLNIGILNLKTQIYNIFIYKYIISNNIFSVYSL